MARETLREIKFRRTMTKEKRQWTAEYKKKQIDQTTLEQRKIFIETLREYGEKDGHYGDFHIMNWKQAMEKSGITDQSVAYEVYRRNSRPKTGRVLVPPKKVR